MSVHVTHPACELWPRYLMNNYGTPALQLVSGDGVRVWDAEGRSYIDLLAGIAVNSLGHAHPAVVDAVTTQVRTLGHVSNYFATEPVVRLAATLASRFARGNVDIEQSTRVMLCNSGTEANEAVFKLARLTGRSRIIATENGFHGRTMGALAMTGQPDKREAFEPMPPGVEFCAYNDIDAIRTLVEKNPHDTAAVILEPVQGEIGVIPARDGYLAAVRSLCDEYGILMVIDEVQTGVGRTGTFFAHEHDDVYPDIVTMAKALGGGLPIGACLARGHAGSLFTPGAHGTTFGGNPISCAAANAVCAIVDDDFLAEVRRRGSLLRDGVAALPGVAQVRGRGLMLGVVLDAAYAKDVVAAGYRHGVILNACGDSVIRLVPPLIITDDDIVEAVSRVESALSDVCSQKGDSQ